MSKLQGNRKFKSFPRDKTSQLKKEQRSVWFQILSSNSKQRNTFTVVTKYYFKPGILYPVKYLAGKNKIKNFQTGKFSENLTPTVPVIGSYVRMYKTVSGKMGYWEIVALILEAVKGRHCIVKKQIVQLRAERWRSSGQRHLEKWRTSVETFILM